MRANLQTFRGAVLDIVLCVVLPCSALSAQTPSAVRKTTASGTFTISGTVVSATTGTPLPQTRVTILDVKNPGNTASAITGEGGRFSFTHLGPAKYSLQGARRGYISSRYEQHEQYSTAIVTGEEFDTEKMVLRLMPMAVISGKVLDEMGEAVRDAQVKLYGEDHSSGMTRITQSGGTATNDLGVFEFFSLPPGKYFASVLGKPWYAIHPPSTPPGGAGAAPVVVDKSLDVAYPTTYYGGSTESDGATPIVLHGGDHEQIDIHLTPVAALHLLFHVTEDEQHRMAAPMLEKHVFDSVDYVANEGVNPLSPGVYELTGVPAGKYSVRIQSSGNPREPAKFTEADVINDGQELETDTAEMAASMKLSIHLANNEPLPKQLALGLQDERHKIVAFHRVTAEGVAEFSDLAAGTYTIVSSRTPEKAYAVARISSEGGEMVGPSVNVTSGAALQLDVTLVSGTVHVDGFAKRGFKPASGVMVVLIPAQPESQQDLFRRDQSDSDGSFSLAEVIPGSYTVVAIEDAWEFDWSQPSLLARYAKYGQPVTISENKQGTTHLPDAVQVQPR